MRQPDHRVVVIDDDPHHLDMLVTVLERAGIRGTGFTDPHAALDHLIGHCAALAVVDLRMPGLDGLELVRRLHISQPGLPLIGISGATDASPDLDLMRESGATTVLRKPLTPGRFVTTIKDALRLAAQRGVS